MSLRALAVVLAVAPLWWPAAAAAETAAARSPASLLEVIEGDGSAAERKAAIDELIGHPTVTVKALRAFAEREHASTADQRRAVLRKIGAAVPDKKGKFKNPKRQKASEKKANDQFDWMPKLLELAPSSAAVR